jgi:hypothetical protein
LFPPQSWFIILSDAYRLYRRTQASGELDNPTTDVSP